MKAKSNDLQIKMVLGSELDDLTDKSVFTNNSHMRRAIQLYFLAVQAARDGQRIAILDKDDNILKEVTGLCPPSDA